MLKPLSWAECESADNLASYLESGYPRADFFFAVPSYEDRAAEAPVALRSQYPYASITLIVGDEADVANRKIAKVIRMAERAERADAFVLSDADISVERGHLERIIGELFADDRVGLVTCAYRARPAGSFASRLAALFINTDFAPMVMLAVAMEPLRYAFGATIAVRRTALEAAGGMRPLGDKLADDFELGRAVVASGWEARLSRSLVTSACEEQHLRRVLAAQARWARTYRIMRPLSLLTILINGPLWALVMLAVTHARPAAIAVCASRHRRAPGDLGADSRPHAQAPGTGARRVAGAVERPGDGRNLGRELGRQRSGMGRAALHHLARRYDARNHRWLAHAARSRGASRSDFVASLLLALGLMMMKVRAGALPMARGRGTLGAVMAWIRDPVWIGGLAVQAAGYALYMVALAGAPVSMMAVAMQGGIALFVVLAVVFLGERARHLGMARDWHRSWWRR